MLGDGGRGSILSVTLFVQQHDRGTCCELLLAINICNRYLVRGARGLRIIRKK